MILPQMKKWFSQVQCDVSRDIYDNVIHTLLNFTSKKNNIVSGMVDTGYGPSIYENVLII